MSKNIFAYTALESNYPEFISINVDETGAFEIVVRSSAKEDGRCGETVSVKLTTQQSLNLAMNLVLASNVRVA